MTTNRDHRLDIFRSLTMIHIVCVIHVIYWIKIFDEPWRSLLLRDARHLLHCRRVAVVKERL